MNDIEKNYNLGTVNDIKNYLQEHKDDIDSEIFSNIEESLKVLGELEIDTNQNKIESQLDQLSIYLQDILKATTDEDKKEEIQELVDGLEKEKSELKSLKEEISSAEQENVKNNKTEEGIENDESNKSNESNGKDGRFKRNWKWLTGIGVGGVGIFGGIKLFSKRGQKKAYIKGKMEDLKKEEAYKDISDRKLKKLAKKKYKEEFGKTKTTGFFATHPILKKIKNRGLVAGAGVAGFFGIKWLVDKRSNEQIPDKQDLPSAEQDDTEKIATEHEAEVVSLGTSTFKKLKKSKVKEKNGAYYVGGEKVELRTNSLNQAVGVCYKKDIGRVIPSGDPNGDGYKTLEDKSGNSVQPTFSDTDEEPKEGVLYYLQFDEKKTEVATVAPIVEQLQTAIEENKKRKNPLDPKSEVVGDLSAKRGDIGCKVLDKKGNEVTDWETLTQEEFEKKVDRVTISSRIGEYKNGVAQQFSTDICIIERGGKKYYRIPNCDIELEKTGGADDEGKLTTMVRLANLTNFCLYKYYGDKSRESRNGNWLYKTYNFIMLQKNGFSYITPPTTAIWRGLVVVYNGSNLQVVKHETMQQMFKLPNGNDLRSKTYGPELAEYLNTRVKQFEKHDEKLLEEQSATDSTETENEAKETEETSEDTQTQG